MEKPEQCRSSCPQGKCHHWPKVTVRVMSNLLKNILIMCILLIDKANINLFGSCASFYNWCKTNIAFNLKKNTILTVVVV